MSGRPRFRTGPGPALNDVITTHWIMGAGPATIYGPSTTAAVVEATLAALAHDVKYRQDHLDYHSSVEQAAATATRAGVGALVLTHYVPPMPSAMIEQWRDLVPPIYAGTAVLGDDLTSYEIPETDGPLRGTQ